MDRFLFCAMNIRNTKCFDVGCMNADVTGISSDILSGDAFR